MNDYKINIPERLLLIWGRTILGSGWASVPNELLKNQNKLELSNSELVLLIHLISFMHHDDSKVYPSIELLSKRMSQDRRTIQRTINRLISKKIIRKKIRSTSRLDKGLTNIYDLSPLMLKLISFQIPSLPTPKYVHSCPSCGVTASSREDVEQIFGFRMVEGKERIQSWCRNCRGRKK
ncbi:helix-turn-helix domain-containing protein [Proteus terrae]|uniref:helix-turn-helix domain-containing protein n=1 Tax=Proteus terrae TaxID=1574161 RepID=UPI00301B7B79